VSGAFWRRERARIESWAPNLDPTLRGEIDWLRIWVVLTLVLVALVAVVGWAPGLRGFFGLRPAVPAAALALAQSSLLLSIRLQRRGDAPLRFALVSLLSAFLFQVFASSLVIQSDPPGAFALAVLPLLMASFAGLLMRGGPSFPWVTPVEALGMGAALALRPDAPHLGLFALLGPIALGSCLFLGWQVERLERERARAERQRTAIQAQVLEERAGDARRLVATLAEIAARNREAAEALSASTRASEALEQASLGGAGDDRETLAASLRGSLERVKQALDATLDLGRARELRGEALDVALVAALARGVAEAARRRFPRVAVVLRCASAGAERASAVVRGGAENLRLALEQLVTNACESHGGGGARWVEIAVEEQPRLDALAVRVSDDGPGFPEELLGRPVAPFVTTKSNGGGLGLYTAERLVRASGGSLRRENLPGRGAAVTVFLRRARGGEEDG
jgi:signal transduction histidine kinase